MDLNIDRFDICKMKHEDTSSFLIPTIANYLDQALLRQDLYDLMTP